MLYQWRQLDCDCTLRRTSSSHLITSNRFQSRSRGVFFCSRFHATEHRRQKITTMWMSLLIVSSEQCVISYLCYQTIKKLSDFVLLSPFSEETPKMFIYHSQKRIRDGKWSQWLELWRELQNRKQNIYGDLLLALSTRLHCRSLENLLCSNFSASFSMIFLLRRQNANFPRLCSFSFSQRVTWLLLTKWLECSKLKETKKLSNNCKFPWLFFD